jgi:hypothetical protein
MFDDSTTWCLDKVISILVFLTFVSWTTSLGTCETIGGTSSTLFSLFLGSSSWFNQVLYGCVSCWFPQLISYMYVSSSSFHDSTKKPIHRFALSS